MDMKHYVPYVLPDDNAEFAGLEPEMPNDGNSDKSKLFCPSSPKILIIALLAIQNTVKLHFCILLILPIYLSFHNCIAVIDFINIAKHQSVLILGLLNIWRSFWRSDIFLKF